MVKFKDFSRPLYVFQVFIKANLIFKDFSRQSCTFKYFSSLCDTQSWSECVKVDVDVCNLEGIDPYNREA